MLTRFYQNHILANLSFALVLLVGFLSYQLLPREQDPTINFNWIDITTIVPGASAEDVEKRVTDILEDAIRQVSDIKFVSSNSREGVSSILIRFNDDIEDVTFDKRVNDLRREIQNKDDELPPESEDSFIFEITSANAFPSATILVSGPADDENLRKQAESTKKDLERIKGVERVMQIALSEPELQVLFLPERLEGLGINPVTVAETVREHFRDISAGSTEVDGLNWLVRLIGTDSDPAYLAGLPVMSPQGEIPLGSIAELVRAREKAKHLASYEGQPAIILAISKKANVNTLELVKRINEYVQRRNRFQTETGVNLVLVDDQTEITRNALDIMQTNALLGLLFVLLVTWGFLGSRIALLTSIGIPFILAGTFWILKEIGQTLNVSVLLGIVISLGMLVDDAVVVVEGIYYRLQRGEATLSATLEALREVFAPVTTAVLTTMAAFLPLMLLPGILGKFMLIIPLVVTVALAISLVEAYWMLPAHIISARVSFRNPSRMHRYRVKGMHMIRIRYTRALIRVMRYPKTTFVGIIMLFVSALGALDAGLIKIDFFASDPIRLFYVNIEMPSGTPLQQTLDTVLKIEEKVRRHVRAGEVRGIVSYAGQMFTETAPLQGKHYGQILVTLQPETGALRSVDEMIEDMRADVEHSPGPLRITFLRLAGGPPTSKPISIKVRGDEIAEIRRASEELKAIMGRNKAILDIGDDDSPGQMELTLRLDHDAVRRAGLSPLQVARVIRLFVDGEIVASMQEQGEELEVRIRAKPRSLDAIGDLLDHTLPTAEGGSIPLGELVYARRQAGLVNIRHYNFRRTITVEADIDKNITDTVSANQFVLQEWEKINQDYANTSLDFSGELDDIQESIDSIMVLFLFGIGLMYAILGT